MSNTQTVEVTYKFRERDGKKRPNVTLNFPALTEQGIIATLEDRSEDNEKLRELITETLTGVQYAYIRSFVDADLEYTQEKLDELIAREEISLAYIATKPRADRNVISKSDLEEFAKVYVPIIMAATGKDQDRVEKGAAVMVNRFNPVRGDQRALAILSESLEVFTVNATEEQLAEHEAALTYLVGKVEELKDAHISADVL